MPARISELELEQRMRLPEQQVLTRIWYEQNMHTSHAFDCSDFHSIERVIYFETASGKKFKMQWADELGIYHGFGISLKAIPAIDANGAQLTEVTDHPAWEPYREQPITTVHVHWQRILDNMRTNLVPVCGIGYLRRIDYPQTLELIFKNNSRLFISVLKIDPSYHNIPLTNNLTIFFNSQQFDAYYQPLRSW
jgi:hypothetical protein